MLIGPSMLSYGFFLLQSLLILIISIIYSVMPSKGFILGFGLVYTSDTLHANINFYTVCTPPNYPTLIYRINTDQQ